MKKISIIFATRSEFKRREIEAVSLTGEFLDFDNVTRKVGDRFDIRFSDVRTDEPLEIDLVAMVRHKAVSAYRSLLVPCLVEHAGLIFEATRDAGFPGGLTQPMWDSLKPEGEGFLSRTHGANEPAIARAVFGYCDGMEVRTFVGETQGKIADRPRGDRRFYWDTVFCPVEFGGKTYAEVAQEADGIAEKMKISQSFRALRQFLELRARVGASELFA